MTFILSHYFEKIKVDSCDSFTYNRKSIDFACYNITALIKSVLNKDKSHSYYKIFLEKCLYQLAKK